MLKKIVRVIVLWAFDGRLPAARGTLRHDPAALDRLARRIKSS
jgi:hypothetical protein